MWTIAYIGSHPEDLYAESGWRETYFDKSLLITALSKQLATKQTAHTTVLEDWELMGCQSRQIGDYIPVDEKSHILVSYMTLNPRKLITLAIG